MSDIEYLQGAVSVVSNMLVRDNTPIRLEAATELKSHFLSVRDEIEQLQKDKAELQESNKVLVDVREKALFYINTNWMRYNYPVREEEKALTDLWNAIEEVERAAPDNEHNSIGGEDDE